MQYFYVLHLAIYGSHLERSKVFQNVRNTPDKEGYVVSDHDICEKQLQLPTSSLQCKGCMEKTGIEKYKGCYDPFYQNFVHAILSKTLPNFRDLLVNKQVNLLSHDGTRQPAWEKFLLHCGHQAVSGSQR